MTSETFTNWLPLVGMLVLVGLLGVLALVDWWRERRRRRALRKFVASMRQWGLMTQNEVIELLRGQVKR